MAGRRARVALAHAALAGVVLTLAACGGDDKASNDGAPVATTPAAQESSDVVSVGMKDIKFIPESITAKVGQKIVWTNNEDIPHTVVATSGADFASDALRKDQTYEFTPKKAGTIKYVCTIHSGQNGEITVTG